MKNKIKGFLKIESEAINNIPITENFNTAIELIKDKIHDGGGKLVFSGLGKAGQIALNISTTFSSTGTCSVYLHPTEAQHGDLGILKDNDILFLLSNSGKTREVLELVELSKKFSPNIKIISVSSNKDSTLAKKSDVFLWMGKFKEICPLGLTPTVSTTIMSVIGDILVSLMIEKIGFTNEEYSIRHHSGYLNLKARGLV